MNGSRDARSARRRPLAPVVAVALAIASIAALAGAACADGTPGAATRSEAPARPRPTPGPEDRGPVDVAALREASGLVASRSQPGVLWAHNDSGDRPRLYAIGDRGEHLGTFLVDGARHVDWEDIAARGDRLYVGDIGDNDAKREVKTVYRVREPRIDRSGPPADDERVTGVETIRLVYPDGPVDAETLLVEPRSGDLYVVTKRSTTVQVLRARAPLSTDDRPIVMERAGTLRFDRVPHLGRGGQGAVGGDVSPDGRLVLVKTYDAVWSWRREPDGPLFDGARVRLPYVPEPQGEAITVSAHGPPRYFTLSEERDRIPARLWAYPLPARGMLETPEEAR